MGGQDQIVEGDVDVLLIAALVAGRRWYTTAGLLKSKVTVWVPGSSSVQRQWPAVGRGLACLPDQGQGLVLDHAEAVALARAVYADAGAAPVSA